MKKKTAKKLTKMRQPRTAKKSRVKSAQKRRSLLVRDCMSQSVEVGSPDMSISEAAERMRDGDFGMLPVGERDRLIGTITDRDIAVRAVAENLDPKETRVEDVMSKKVLYCFDDQDISDVARNMGENQVRRLPVVNREKRLVGILSLGDIAEIDECAQQAREALTRISEHEHREPQEHFAA